MYLLVVRPVIAGLIGLLEIIIHNSKELARCLPPDEWKKNVLYIYKVDIIQP